MSTISSSTVRAPGLSDGTEVSSVTSSLKKASKPKSATPRGSGRTAKASKGTGGIEKIKAETNDRPKSKSQPKPKPIPRRIKVGVDFGTTNSGVAHVLTVGCDVEDVEVISNWSGGLRRNERLEKVPSLIAFREENEGVNEDKWGYEVPAGAKSYTWFKLHLDSNAETSSFDSDELTGKLGSVLRKLPDDMTAAEITTAYLSYIYRHLMEELQKRHTAEVCKKTPIDFWLTVPATWQNAATDATRRAAMGAGFARRRGDTLNIITEPEAAAIAILSRAVGINPGLVGKNVLICDLGGGTLDFQVLTVEGIAPHLQMVETIPGIGGKCGSVHIDCSFHTWATTTFGNAFKELPEDKTGTSSLLMNEFELLKKTFNGRDLGKTYQISFPALGNALRERNLESASYDFEDHTILVTGHDLVDMFEDSMTTAFDIIDEILAKLDKERKARFDIMCLCGGLGSSEYVWKRFDEYKRAKFGESCQIQTDPRAWSAVVRGATIRGLQGSLVLERRAKRAYGVGIHQQFQEGIDSEVDAELCPVKGKIARGYVYWPVRIGQPFHDNMRILTKLYVIVNKDDGPTGLCFMWQLFSCALENLPDREEDTSVKPEGTIQLDLSDLWDIIANRLKAHEALRVDIVFKMGSERGTLVVEALHGRKVVGETTIDYSRTHARSVYSQSVDQPDDD